MKKILKDFLTFEFDPAFEERARFIFKNIEKIKPKKVLDIGCGRGFYLYCLNSYSFIKEIHGIDINPSYLKIAKRINSINEKVIIKKASVYSLPYPKNYFDLIIASEILEHLKNDKKALLEINRVLKRKGSVIITTPNFNFPLLWDPLNWILIKLFKTHINKNIWWLAGIWADHEKLYTLNELKKLLQNSNFKIKSVKTIVYWCWPFSHFFLYGIGKNLVEKLKFKEFNRFNFKKKSFIIKILAFIFKLPSKLLDETLKRKSSVNILLIGAKNKIKI